MRPGTCSRSPLCHSAKAGETRIYRDGNPGQRGVIILRAYRKVTPPSLLRHSRESGNPEQQGVIR